MSTAAPFSPALGLPLSPLHVGVDANNLLQDRRGIGRYARALLQRWLHLPSEVQISLFVPHALPGMLRKRLAEILCVERVAVYNRKRAATLGLDILWYPWSGMTWLSAARSVATVHDVWPFASPAADPRKRQHEQAPFYATAAYAAAVITDSQFSKAEIMHHLNVPEDRIFVVHLGVDMPDSGAVGVPLLDGATRYILFVGEAEERKGLRTLELAMRQLPETQRASTGLVVVGKQPQGVRRIGKLEASERVILRFQPHEGVNTIVAGEISDALLARLYAGAAALAFPSTYEGFGLPILEAMARGVPVVAANAASIPEVAADAAVYFAAGSAASLSRELQAVLSDDELASRLGKTGRARAAAMNWDRCAMQTLAVLRATAQQVRREETPPRN